jgi:hypothetical protein
MPAPATAASKRLVCVTVHGHEPAVTIRHAEACESMGYFFVGIDSGQRVTQIAAAEIFHVRASELFSLTIAAARIGKKNVITACR